MIAVVALGGNALIRRGERGFFEEQLANAARAVRPLIRLILDGHGVIITHGNGPQVGNIFLQQEAVAPKIPPMPLDACGAMSQGLIGYMIQQALSRGLEEHGIRPVSIVTRVVVDSNDPEFRAPSKPIGPFYSKGEAERLIKEKGWPMVYQKGKGWRRVVPSPEPVEILEIGVVKRLVDQGVPVVAAGGGGIPVVRQDRGFRGVEAVIDKDKASSLLATRVGADIFVILTDVPGAAINFGTEREEFLGKIRVGELEAYYKEGHFPKGSMGPKVISAIRFVKATGKPAVIAHLDEAEKAFMLKAGTIVVP